MACVVASVITVLNKSISLFSIEIEQINAFEIMLVD